MSNKGKGVQEVLRVGSTWWEPLSVGMEKGEWKFTANRSAPTAHFSSKLTERLSLRNSTQADYHPRLGHFERQNFEMHQCKKRELKAAELAEPPRSAPWLDLTSGQNWTFCNPALTKSQKVRLYSQQPQGLVLSNEWSEWVIVLLYCIFSDLWSLYTAKTLK